MYDLAFDVATVTGNVTSVTINEAGSGYGTGNVTNCDTELGGVLSQNAYNLLLILFLIRNYFNRYYSYQRKFKCPLKVQDPVEQLELTAIRSTDANGNVTVTLLDTQQAVSTK